MYMIINLNNKNKALRCAETFMTILFNSTDEAAHTVARLQANNPKGHYVFVSTN